MLTNRTNSRILTFSAAALLAGGTAFAQMQPGVGAGQSMPSQQAEQQTNPATGMTATTGASFADQAFVASIIESDVAQVQLGQLAQQKSSSADVKQLAQQIIDNRTKLSEQLKPIAEKLEVSEPKKPSKKDKELMAKLEGLSGPQFDEEYIKAVAKDNQRDVKDFTSEAETAQDPTLQQAAKQDATVLAQHQQALEQVAQAHNIALDEKK